MVLVGLALNHIAAGANGSWVIPTEGAVVGWGSLTGATNNPSQIIAVASGGELNLALRSDGTVANWMDNRSLPEGLTNITAIAAGWAHGLALRRNGTVFAWGYNGNGQTHVPTALSNVVAIAAGTYHSLALKDDGTVIAWGGSIWGHENYVPSGLSNVVAISTAGWIPPDIQGAGQPGGFSLALKRDGTVVGWGYNAYGQANVPAGLSNVVAVAAGYAHSLALRSDGTVVGWGNNYWGAATGVPKTTVPYGATGTVMVAGQVLSNVVAVAAGTSHSLALKSDGTIVAWGANSYGQATVPSGLSNVVAIAAGYLQSLAITIDLKIHSLRFSDQGPVLGLRTFAGQQYAIEHSPDLSPGSWVGLPNGSIAGDGSDTFLTDTNAAGAPARFYRVKLVP